MTTETNSIKVRVLSVQGLSQTNPPAGYSNEMTCTADVFVDGTWIPGFTGLKVVGPRWAPNVLLGVPDLTDEEQATAIGIDHNGDIHVQVEWKPLVGPCGGEGDGTADIPPGSIGADPIGDFRPYPNIPIDIPVSGRMSPMLRAVARMSQAELAILGDMIDIARRNRG